MRAAPPPCPLTRAPASRIHHDRDQLANARVAEADAPSHHYNRSKPRKLLAIQQGGVIIELGHDLIEQGQKSISLSSARWQLSRQRMMPNKTSAVLRSIREWVPRAVVVWTRAVTELSLSILCTWIPTTRYKIRFRLPKALRRKRERIKPNEIRAIAAINKEGHTE
jgi:hypothetical protein